ncbi:MAG TPA: FkbM family methyltransferase, partial [Solirubrobacteraceae bacterium]
LEIRRGAWTEPELRLIPELVAPGETAVDVGANYGLWCWHLGRAVAPTGRVVAFEPVPATARSLRRILTLLGLGKDVEIHALGCGERHETRTFQIPSAGLGGPPIAGLAHMTGIESAREPTTLEANVVPLDAAVIHVNVSLLKVDVEGAELFVLRGASGILAEQQPTVICEIGRGLLRERYGIEPSSLVELMRDHGYSIMRLEGERLKDADLSHGHDGNYVFISERYRHRAAARLQT